MTDEVSSQDRLQQEILRREGINNPTISPAAVIEYYRKSSEAFYYLIETLNLASVSPQLAQQLAVQFLQGMNRINGLLLEIKNHLIGFRQIRNIELSHACKASGEKSVAAQEREAELNPKYQNAQTYYETLKNSKEYYENLYTMFDRGHVMYKNLAIDN